MSRFVIFLCILFIFGLDTRAETYKQLPPSGIAIDAAEGQRLRMSVRQLQQQLDAAAADSADAQQWRPDVEVLIRAVRLALEQNLFFKKGQVADAKLLLDEASKRLSAAAAGDRGLRLIGLSIEPTADPQLLVGGFVSRIDDSVQPYGLVIPPEFDVSSNQPCRMDVWLHGRGDTKTEIPFLRERMTKVGTYAPAETIVLHPFGRHCNAFKFAGERDVYESIAHVESLGFDRQRTGWPYAVSRWAGRDVGTSLFTIRRPGLPPTPVPVLSIHWSIKNGMTIRHSHSTPCNKNCFDGTTYCPG